MHSGNMNDAITIERKVQVGITASLGEATFVWQTFLEPMAEVVVRRGREHFDPTTKQRFAEDVYHFRCNREDVFGLDATMRIVDENDQTFDIKSIRPGDDKQDCIIECTLQDATLGAAALLGYVDDAVPAGTVGEAYEGFTFRAKGGTAPYTYAVTSGSLPAGLSLAGSTGAVSGTPSAAGTSSPVVTVTDGAGDTHTLPAIEITIAAA